MAELNPPFVVGQSNSTAASFRNLVSGLYGNTSGVLGTSDLTVTNTSLTSMSVAAGSAVIFGTHAAYQGSYLASNDAARAMTITPTGSGLRFDLVIARVRDKDYAVDASSTEGWALEFIVGATHATTPVEPTVVTVAPTGGASTFLVLARITVNTSGYVAASLVDRRAVASPTAGPTITTTTLLGNAPALVAGEGSMVYNTVTSSLLVNDGATTPAYNPPWNLPWGLLAYREVGSILPASGTFSTSVTEISSALRAIITSPANRVLRFTVSGAVNTPSTGAGWLLDLYNQGAGTVITEGRMSSSTVALSAISVSFYGSTVFTNTTASAITYSPYITAASGNLNVVSAFGVQPVYFSVEDLGPSGIPA